ncbi:MAG: universal stress protein UspA [Xanthomarina sp.]|uniref:universal stress protein n=1 Tax=Xanthomarina sp. TaxID=1931211 RepID=UPI000C3649F6|nr:universal stress protein [Xanthomarina sp.]MAL22398.1 universal stress protein UspA [Xanthomarina sp.]MBF60931.1 universal stress protein UspA [Xanthomarina sp.]HAB28854.1 universal stress protein UspA [Xanthomarina gelatinilytica]HAI17548.1 universal stress protein UspA [Xanthomarina gelatinilytica]|tara:strand:- start:4204 stop:5001 length:798 start_codon:yes stop_codon:yes gene_type:complete
MKNILVPVGSSKNAVSHLQYAVDFAKAFGAKLHVVQIYNIYTKAGTMIKVDHILERESLEFLKSHVAKVDTKGVDVHIKTFKGKLVDTIELVCKSLDIDLILIEPRTNSIREEVYLGKTSGKIIKQTNIPALIVPEGYTYKPIIYILMALKSAIIKKENALNPLMDIKNQFKSIVNLLLVKTPYHNEGDFDIDEKLSAIITNTTYTENATTFQGVLEHYKDNDPDLLCVVRRKRGFFTKLWEKNTILKKDFQSTTLPVLVLSGLK